MTTNKKIRVVITGAEGQLGTTLRNLLKDTDRIEGIYVDKDKFDITDKKQTADFFANCECDFLVNCAAYTNVDKAESEENLANDINAKSLSFLGEEARKHGFKIIHISTDYVFDGNKTIPYTEADATNPQTSYGRTKLEGERLLFQEAPDSIVIRTAWLYSPYGRNFFLTMMARAQKSEAVRVVADQKGVPTLAADLATAIIKILQSETWKPGIYHYTGKGETTWFEFTRTIFELAGADPALVSPIKSHEYPSVAQRPSYSVLDTGKINSTYDIEIPCWQDSLKKLMNELNGNK